MWEREKKCGGRWKNKGGRENMKKKKKKEEGEEGGRGKEELEREGTKRSLVV